jgi:hypothetical protein
MHYAAELDPLFVRKEPNQGAFKVALVVPLPLWMGAFAGDGVILSEVVGIVALGEFVTGVLSINEATDTSVVRWIDYLIRVEYEYPLR